MEQLARRFALAQALASGPSQSRRRSHREGRDRGECNHDQSPAQRTMGRAVAPPSSESPSDAPIELTAPLAFKRRGVEMRLVLPDTTMQTDRSRCDPTLIKAIARGRVWFEEQAAGRARSLRELAERDGITRRYVRRLVDFAFLSPTGRGDPARPATHRTHRDPPHRTRSAARLALTSAACWPVKGDSTKCGPAQGLASCH